MRADSVSARRTSRNRIAIANTARPRIRPPFPRSKEKAESTVSRSSVPETIASAIPPRKASSTAAFDIECRRQTAKAIRSTAKMSPAARSAVSSSGKTAAKGRTDKAAARIARYPAATMRVLILGGDGYLGWPTAMRFSARGHEVSVVDNFSRRHWHERHGTDSLTPIRALDERIGAWHEVSGNQIRSYVGAIEDADFLEEVIVETKPEAIIHYGEQPSAPYSMASREQAVETQYTNVIGTLNLLWLRCATTYRTATWSSSGRWGSTARPTSTSRRATSRSSTRAARTRCPSRSCPGSLYHLSKVHDSHNIHFACRIWGLRSTDLNQGVVYGIEHRRDRAGRATLHPLRLRRVSSARSSTASASRPSSGIR